MIWMNHVLFYKNSWFIKKNSKAFKKEIFLMNNYFCLSINEEIINYKNLGYILKLKIPNINDYKIYQFLQIDYH